MFDNELRKSKDAVRSLSIDIDRVISRNESTLNNLKKEFDKENGVAEKSIDQRLVALKSETDQYVKDFEKNIDKELNEYKKSLSDYEKHALEQIDNHKKASLLAFEEKTYTLMVFKGEL